MSELTRPIIGIENRTAQEVFDIMCDRFRRTPSPSPAPGMVEALTKARDYIIGLGQSPQAGGWPRDQYAVMSEIETALASLSQPAKGERKVLDGGIDGPYNESAPLADVVATAQPALRQECATEGCDNPASVHFVRGDIGSYYCHACYLKVQALTPANPAQVTDATHVHAWIVGSGDGKRWRTWVSGSSDWTDDREKATRYSRREDAEAVHCEDEDAWFVVPYKDLPNDADEAYEIGVRDGYEDAIQDLDLATGGDGEFRGSTFPGRTVDVPTMRQRIIDRFAAIGAGGQAITQFRKAGCSDWYDGLPDNEDGRGPYETRTLYSHPAPSGQAVAVRHSFDGDGWLYADKGNGSDWLKRAMAYSDAEPLFTLSQPHPADERVVEALERIRDLTPADANARSAQDLYLSVKAIAVTALTKEGRKNG